MRRGQAKRQRGGGKSSPGFLGELLGEGAAPCGQEGARLTASSFLLQTALQAPVLPRAFPQPYFVPWREEPGEGYS